MLRVIYVVFFDFYTVIKKRKSWINVELGLRRLVGGRIKGLEIKIVVEGLIDVILGCSSKEESREKIFMK